MKKMNTEEFICEAKKNHGEKYDYSKTNYVSSKQKVSIFCKLHGEFLQSPSNHLNGQRCPGCFGKLKKTTEEFTEDARKIHNDKYDYSLVVYKGTSSKVKIVCKKHGTFKQRPTNHLKNQGCPKCGDLLRHSKKRKTTEWFVNKANKIHNSKYDYSQTVYSLNKLKVLIICKDHGKFKQGVGHHLDGRGCPECGYKIVKMKNSNSQEEFIKNAKRIHKNKYDYSLVDYKGNKIKVKIICPHHGIFGIRPGSHSSARGSGCDKCGGTANLTTETFIEKAVAKHGDKYDYSLVDYKGIQNSVAIICKKHGKFLQKATDHINCMAGCHKCKSSKGEVIIRQFLIGRNIKFEEQKRFTDCKNTRPLPFDFYLTGYNTLIEYDGEQHFGIGKYANDNVIRNDEIKNNYAIHNNIKLIRIPYTKINEIETYLSPFI